LGPKAPENSEGFECVVVVERSESSELSTLSGLRVEKGKRGIETWAATPMEHNGAYIPAATSL
jgi:hypothetical protein